MLTTNVSTPPIGVVGPGSESSYSRNKPRYWVRSPVTLQSTFLVPENESAPDAGLSIEEKCSKPTPSLSPVRAEGSVPMGSIP